MLCSHTIKETETYNPAGSSAAPACRAAAAAAALSCCSCSTLVMASGSGKYGQAATMQRATCSGPITYQKQHSTARHGGGVSLSRLGDRGLAYTSTRTAHTPAHKRPPALLLEGGSSFQEGSPRQDYSYSKGPP